MCPSTCIAFLDDALIFGAAAATQISAAQSPAGGIRNDRRARSSSAARLNRIGRRKGVLEGFVECLFLTPALVTIAIVLMRFAFRIGNHFGFSDRAAKDFRGYDANFSAFIVKRYPFRVVRLP